MKFVATKHMNKIMLEGKNIEFIIDMITEMELNTII